MATLGVLLYGVLAGLSLVAGLFFASYWRRSRDRLFVFLWGTFWILGAHWASLAWCDPDESTVAAYLPRLASFLLLLVGIADKNRRARRAGEAGEGGAAVRADRPQSPRTSS